MYLIQYLHFDSSQKPPTGPSYKAYTHWWILQTSCSRMWCKIFKILTFFHTMLTAKLGLELQPVFVQPLQSATLPSLHRGCHYNEVKQSMLLQDSFIGNMLLSQIITWISKATLMKHYILTMCVRFSSWFIICY